MLKPKPVLKHIHLLWTHYLSSYQNDRLFWKWVLTIFFFIYANESFDYMYICAVIMQVIYTEARIVKIPGVEATYGYESPCG